MGEVLSVEAVVKDYRRGTQTVRALDDVSVTIDAGEFVSVLGPSGSGKSTLLHLMGALDQPTAGCVRIGGAAVAGLSDDELTELRRHRLGFVFQFFNLLPTLSAWENVAVPLLLDGHRLRSLKRRQCRRLPSALSSRLRCLQPRSPLPSRPLRLRSSTSRMTATRAHSERLSRASRRLHPCRPRSLRRRRRRAPLT